MDKKYKRVEVVSGEIDNLKAEVARLSKEREEYRRGQIKAEVNVGKLVLKLDQATVDKDCCCAGTEVLRFKLEQTNLLISEVMEAAGDLLYPKRADTAEPYLRLKRFVDEHRAKTEKPLSDSAMKVRLERIENGNCPECGQKAHLHNCAEKRSGLARICVCTGQGHSIECERAHHGMTGE